MANLLKRFAAGEIRFFDGDDRSQMTRAVVGGMLIVLFFVGIWLLRPTIVRDMDRMFLWQKIAFWLGDASALIFVMRWIMASDLRPGQRYDAPEKVEGHTAGRFAILMIGALLLDTAFTLSSTHSTWVGINRAEVTSAKILSIETHDIELARHFRFHVSYQDQRGKQFINSMRLTEKFREPVPEWLETPLAIATGKVKSETMPVMFDPQLPMRVWAKGQDYGSTDGIDVLFIVIHMFQMIVVAAAVSSVLGERGSNVRIAPTASLYVIPIVIEIFMLLVLGLTLYQG
jgi:hypothetical protein